MRFAARDRASDLARTIRFVSTHRMPHVMTLSLLRSMLGITTMCSAVYTGFAQEPLPRAAHGATITATSSTGAWSWDQLKNAEFEQRDDFTAQIRTVHTQFRDDVAQLRSRYQETAATESEKKAMTDLEKAETDFDEKLKALDNVSAETWETVKSNLLSSWLNLQEAFRRARPTE
jgi:hypothetical protein